MASFSDSKTLYQGEDLNEWIQHFRLSDLKGLFDELGVSTFADLLDLYSDDESIETVKAKAKKLLYKKFTEAPKLTKALIGQPMSSLLDSSPLIVTAVPEPLPSTYEGTDLREWMIFFKLEGLQSLFEEIGVGCFDDLVEVYQDNDMVDSIRSKGKPLEWKRFKSAPENSSALKGISLAPLISAVTVTSDSVSSSATSKEIPRKMVGGGSASVTIPVADPLEAEAEKLRGEIAALKAAAKKKEQSETVVRMQKELEEMKLVEQLDAATKVRKKEELQRKIKDTKKRGQEIKVLNDYLKGAASVDLCILMDCTGSMSTFITEAKNKIMNLADSIKGTFPDVALRLCFIGYRDVEDGANRLSILPFDEENVESFKTFVSSQRASGGPCGSGSDLCEDVLGGMKVATDMDWQSATRILYHIGDYPCHGSQYHDGVADGLPGGHPGDTPPGQLLDILMGRQVMYFFGRLTRHTDKMIREFNKLCGKEYIVVDDLSSTGAAGMMTSITQSVTTGMRETLSGTRKSGSSDGAARVRAVVLSNAEPVWSTVPVETMHKYQMTLPTSIEELVEADDDFGCVSPVPILKETKVCDHAFAKGGLRAASKALEIDERGREIRVVHKESLSLDSKRLTQEAYEKDLAGHRAATFLAQEFNRVGASLGMARVEYVEASVCQFLVRRGKAYFAQEGLVDGEWEKYNSNCGFLEPNPSKAGVDHSAVQAFSHWTHHITEGAIMIVDCQGSYNRRTNTFTLTDPAVHCTDLTRFDATNLGAEGMKKFFKTHRCNDHCSALGIFRS